MDYVSNNIIMIVLILNYDNLSLAKKGSDEIRGQYS